MKRALIVATVLVLVMVLAPVQESPVRVLPSKTIPAIVPQGRGMEKAVGSAGGQGQPTQAIEYFATQMTSQRVSIMNSYSNTSYHSGVIDLSGHQISGWTLYRVTMDVSNITAAPERESVTDPDPAQNTVGNVFRIYYDSDTALTTDALAQGFYSDQPFDGALVNYSIRYWTLIYNPATYGTAYFVVRSDYSDSTSNVTNPVAVQYVTTNTTANITCSLNLLNASTTYYALIDGESLHSAFGVFPDIMWHYQSKATDTLDSRKHLRGGGWPQINSYDAYLLYTFIPWNRTTGTPLDLTGRPDQVDLRANGTLLSAPEAGASSTPDWEFTSPTGENITFIRFTSNQSVYVFHDLTLWYRRITNSDTIWSVSSPGGSVQWNATMAVSYPSVPSKTGQYVNLSVPADWDATGLYEQSAPATNHTQFDQYGTTVVASSMSDGTWTLVSSAPNYVASIDSVSEAVITSNVTIRNYIQDSSSVNASTGSTNLTVSKTGATVWAPQNETVIDGVTTYVWVISNWTTEGGTYLVEVYWANGTEAGFRSVEIHVYIPTSLYATTPTISAYVDSSFDIEVFFNDTFTPEGLNGTRATVQYSFDGGSNTTMGDLGNGTWTATVSTVGMSPGDYEVTVFGTGSYLENHSIVIDVTLVYSTAPLEITWTNGDNITYYQTTTLQVNYTLQNGTAVSGAWVNVTIGGTTWNLTYNGLLGLYEIQLNGSDPVPGIGTYSVSVSAWRVDYESQTNSTLTFTIRPEPTNITVSWTSATFDWTDSRTLVVNYTDSYGTPISGATQLQVLVNGTEYSLQPSGNVYQIVFNNSFDLGHHIVSVNISKYGYVPGTQEGITFDITETVTTLTVTWFPADVVVPYTSDLVLTVDYYYAGGDVPATATVNVSIDGNRYNLTYDGAVWSVAIPASNLGFGQFNATVFAWLYGYEARTNVTYNVTVVVATLTISTTWTSLDLYYTHQGPLNVTVTDQLGSPVFGAEVNASYRGTNYTLTSVDVGVYSITFNGTDGLGTFQIQITVRRYGVFNTTRDLTLNIVETPTTMSIQEIQYLYNGTAGNTLYHDGSVEIRVSVQDVDGLGVDGLVVNVTIGGDTWPLAPQGGGLYTITFQGDALGVGTHDFTVAADTYGYEGISQSDQIVVAAVPTTVLVTSDVPSVIVINATAVFTIRYVDAHTLAPIAPQSVTVDWVGMHDYSVTGDGYEFNISTLMVPLGDNILTITFALENYTNAQYIRVVNVRAAFTLFTAADSHTVPQNETEVFTTTYYDIDHQRPIRSANVTLAIEGTVYPMVHVGEGTYRAEVWVRLDPGTYTITFHAEATGCAANSTTVTLTVTAKRAVVLEVQVPENAVQGSSITVSATLTDEDGNPIVGATIIFEVTARFDNGSEIAQVLSATTNPDGYASQAYQVPQAATELVVEATFRGTYLYWSASVHSQVIQVHPPGLSENLVRTVQFGLPFILLVGAAYLVYTKKHRPSRERKEKRLREQYERFKELCTLRHFMAVYRDRGTCVFYYPFTEERIQPDLISGFITAITTVYGEIKGDGVQGTLEEIQYKGLILNAYSGKYILGVIIMEGEMTGFLRDRLRFFVDIFESQYEDILKDWSGCVDDFDAEWVVSTLHNAINYDWALPHTLNRAAKTKGVERKVVGIIAERLNERGEFHIKDILPDVAQKLKVSEEEALNILLKMHDEGIIQPISISTIVTRQGLGIPGEGEGEALKIVPPESENTEQEEEHRTTEEDTESEPREDDAEQFIEEVERLLREKSDNDEQQTD